MRFSLACSHDATVFLMPCHHVAASSMNRYARPRKMFALDTCAHSLYASTASMKASTDSCGRPENCALQRARVPFPGSCGCTGVDEFARVTDSRRSRSASVCDFCSDAIIDATFSFVNVMSARNGEPGASSSRVNEACSSWRSCDGAGDRGLGNAGCGAASSLPPAYAIPLLVVIIKALLNFAAKRIVFDARMSLWSLYTHALTRSVGRLRRL